MNPIVKQTFVYIVLLLSISGCLASEPSAEQAAEEWIENFINFKYNQGITDTCDDMRKEASSVDTWTAILGHSDDFFKDEGDTSELEFEIISEDELQAEVHVTGIFQVENSGATEQHSIDEIWRMKKDGDRWQWCGRVE